jgi:hypothetical protein
MMVTLTSNEIHVYIRSPKDPKAAGTALLVEGGRRLFGFTIIGITTILSPRSHMADGASAEICAGAGVGVV